MAASVLRLRWGASCLFTFGPSGVLRSRMDESFVRAQMKGEDFRRMTAAFYRRVKTDDILGPLYPPDDWEAAEKRLGDFLCFRLLGEQTYIQERGHPRLRMRHAPFAIGVAERDRWLELMDAAMEETEVPELSVSVLRPLFRQVADFMRNREEPGPAGAQGHS